jgi:hypothetical protein
LIKISYYSNRNAGDWQDFPTGGYGAIKLGMKHADFLMRICSAAVLGMNQIIISIIHHQNCSTGKKQRGSCLKDEYATTLLHWPASSSNPQAPFYCDFTCI